MLSFLMLCHKNIDAEVIKEKAKPAPEKKGKKKKCCCFFTLCDFYSVLRINLRFCSYEMKIFYNLYVISLPYQKLKSSKKK